MGWFRDLGHWLYYGQFPVKKESSMDVVDQAKQQLSDARWCRVCKVDPPPFPSALIENLVAEIERLRVT